MRLITFTANGQDRLGAWINSDHQVVDLAQAAALQGGPAVPAYSTMQALIEAGPAQWDQARRLIEDAPAEAVLASADCPQRAPLPQPAQLRDFLSFPGHVQGCRQTLGEWTIAQSDDPARKRAELEAAGFFKVPAGYYDHPVYYTCNRLAVLGPEDEVPWPAFSQFIDYELEWAAVIGRAGSQISSARAREHIFGYTVFNDWSARDEQMKVMGGAVNLGPGTGKDFANTLGPCIVTADEIPDPYQLRMTAHVNGELRSDANTSGMHYRFEELIEFLTRGHAVYPGEVLGSGTAGGGCALETRRVMSDGDVVELAVERIGRLRNRVRAPQVHADQALAFSDRMMAAMTKAIR